MRAARAVGNEGVPDPGWGMVPGVAAYAGRAGHPAGHGLTVAVGAPMFGWVACAEPERGR